MPDLALIIIIENYAQSQESFTAKKFKGSLEAGLDFANTLQAKWKREKINGTVVFCTDERAKVPNSRGATLNELITCVEEFGGLTDIDNLYVYFSGHGLRLENDRMPAADVLVAADFTTLATSVTTCFTVDSFINAFRVKLGAGKHYYFLDACRNTVTKRVAAAIFPFEGNGKGDPGLYMIYSTRPGDTSPGGTLFAEKLKDGVNGQGKAKIWESNISTEMLVKFDSLYSYLEVQLAGTQEIWPRVEGSTKTAVIARFRPPPKVKLTLTPEGGMTGEVSLASSRGSQDAIIGPGSITLEILPDSYSISFRTNNHRVPVEPASIDLFDDCAIDLSFPPTPPQSPGPLMRFEAERSKPIAVLNVELPRNTKLFLNYPSTGSFREIDKPGPVEMIPGRFLAILSAPNGELFAKKLMELAPDSTVSLNTSDWTPTLPHESIIRAFPNENGAPEFSESLFGAVTDPDLAVWLAIIGAGRILGPGMNDYSKIAPLPLYDSSQEEPGASPIFILAALPAQNSRLKVGLYSRRSVLRTSKRSALAVEGLPGIFQMVFHPMEPGQQFIDIQIENQPPFMFTSLASRNRCTLITLTLDVDGTPKIGQFLLPIGHLMRELNPDVLQHINNRYWAHGPDFSTPLKDVMKLAQLERAFRRRLSIEEFAEQDLFDLLYGKWLDPIAASLAGYECIRRNKLQYIPEVSNNMRNYFPELPDSQVIARLGGIEGPPPTGVPLFVDGLRALSPEELKRVMPKSSADLDFTGPWTAWRLRT